MIQDCNLVLCPISNVKKRQKSHDEAVNKLYPALVAGRGGVLLRFWVDPFIDIFVFLPKYTFSNSNIIVRASRLSETDNIAHSRGYTQVFPSHLTLAGNPLTGGLVLPVSLEVR